MPGRDGEPTRRRAGVATLLAAAGAACANEQPPPGTLPDSRPPQVARFVPPRDSVVPELGGSARVRFDEPVRLSGALSSRITASPAYRYRFESGFSEVKIRPEGGWRAGAVYCFEIAEGVADLLGNRTDAPIPYCFSTGPPVLPTRVEGRVEDRVTGTPAANARVLFLGLPADTTPYTAVANPRGEFTLRSLPPGHYWAFAFQDGNRDLRLDRRLEPHDSLRFRLDETLGAEPLALALIAPDSTPPVLVEAVAEDSLTVRLAFDEPLSPLQPEAGVVLTDSAGGEVRPRLLHVGEPPAAADAEPGQEAEGRPAPVVTVRLERPLSPGTYAVRARGFANLRELLGGGEATFVHPSAPAGR